VVRGGSRFHYVDLFVYMDGEGRDWPVKGREATW